MGQALTWVVSNFRLLRGDIPEELAVTLKAIGVWEDRPRMTLLRDLSIRIRASRRGRGQLRLGRSESS